MTLIVEPLGPRLGQRRLDFRWEAPERNAALREWKYLGAAAAGDGADGPSLCEPVSVLWEVSAKSGNANWTQETSGIPPTGAGLVHLAQASEDNSTLEEALNL